MRAFRIAIAVMLSLIGLRAIAKHREALEKQQRVLQEQQEDRKNALAVVQKRLDAEYRGLNETYFANTLPMNAQVSYYEDLVTDDEGRATTGEGRAPTSIFVNAYYSRSLRDAEMTEIHEVCHVSLNITGNSDLIADSYAHGPKFESCMQRLAAQGAMRGLW